MPRKYLGTYFAMASAQIVHKISSSGEASKVGFEIFVEEVVDKAVIC